MQDLVRERRGGELDVSASSSSAILSDEEAKA